MSSPSETWFGTCPPGWSVGVLHVGREACEPGHNWQGVRDHYLLHYVRGGHGRVVAGRNTYDLGRGDAFLFAPGEYLNYTADLADPWEYLWVGFRGRHAAELVEPLNLRRDRPMLEMPYSERIVEIFVAMIDSARDREIGSDLRVIGLLYELFAEILSIRSEPRSRTTAVDLVREARLFAEQNYQRPIDVSSIIRHIGVDRSHFSRVFREQEGTSLRDLLIGIRMEHARRLLLDTNLAVRAVSASVGYRTYATFERRYRAVYGCSPSEERSRSRSDSSSIR